MSGWRTTQEKDNLFKVSEARENTPFRKMRSSPGLCDSVGWVSSCKPKGRRSDPLWGICPGGGFIPGQGVYKRQPIGVSLPLFLPPFSSL